MTGNDKERGDYTLDLSGVEPDPIALAQAGHRDNIGGGSA